MTNSVNKEGITELLRFIGCVLSSMASGTNLLLIYDMGILNVHILLITVMSIYQLFFDVVFYLWQAPIGSRDYNIAVFMGLWGGLGSSVVSNIMMLNVLSIIYYGKTVFAKDGSEFCSLFFVSCLLPCAVDIIYGVGLAYPDNSPSITISAGYLYSALRLLSLAINFFAYALAEYKVNRMMGGKKLCDLSVQAISVRILVNRLRYYPLLQAVARLFYTGYEFTYGLNFNPTNTTPSQFAAQCLCSVWIPVQAIGYFAIFLYMQPRAYNHFMMRICNCRRYVPSVAQPNFQNLFPADGGGNAEPKSGTNQSWFTSFSEFNQSSNRRNDFDTSNFSKMSQFDESELLLALQQTITDASGNHQRTNRLSDVVGTNPIEISAINPVITGKASSNRFSEGERGSRFSQGREKSGDEETYVEMGDTTRTASMIEIPENGDARKEIAHSHRASINHLEI